MEGIAEMLVKLLGVLALRAGVLWVWAVAALGAIALLVGLEFLLRSSAKRRAHEAAPSNAAERPERPLPAEAQFEEIETRHFLAAFDPPEKWSQWKRDLVARLRADPEFAYLRPPPDE